MANLLTADLPSSDEEDEEYDPTRDLAEAKKREREELLNAPGSQPGGSRSRKGGLAELPELARQREALEGAGEKHAAPGDALGWRESSQHRARRARVEGAWRKLQQGTSSSRPEEEEGHSHDTSGNGGGSTGRFAAQAMANARLGGASASGGSLPSGTHLVKETRNFAGKDVEVVREVDASSREGARAMAASRAAAQGRGIDYVLHLLDRKRKLNVVDKTRLDWKDFKRENAKVQEELASYVKGTDRHVDKVGFLQRAERREYEKERDAASGPPQEPEEGCDPRDPHNGSVGMRDATATKGVRMRFRPSFLPSFLGLLEAWTFGPGWEEVYNNNASKASKPLHVVYIEDGLKGEADSNLSTLGLTSRVLVPLQLRLDCFEFAEDAVRHTLRELRLDPVVPVVASQLTHGIYQSTVRGIRCHLGVAAVTAQQVSVHPLDGFAALANLSHARPARFELDRALHRLGYLPRELHVAFWKFPREASPSPLGGGATQSTAAAMDDCTAFLRVQHACSSPPCALQPDGDTTRNGDRDGVV
eukprot:CAMPEP_0198237954 /NCGR_PEP_ID=MMETSP1446-20131203/3689_1 /TAXON_ID=1461542 ORGANISM="Unidentified sp, Strain CCMP2111" /NCGR_SAMPLE_ID=MMETSP1446 /ASSEMBLY_ACC=CAM_ASM_001112 /LENGTH=533 /DNA_ID=CAMNT_0043920233 /DNA_START=83 /DNA_END=1684 /DNA_ORIENTATION=-